MISPTSLFCFFLEIIQQLIFVDKKSFIFHDGCLPFGLNGVSVEWLFGQMVFGQTVFGQMMFR
jgi:hypothetical protein